MNKYKYKYSAKNNAFFPASGMEMYTDAGWILDDLIDVSDDVFSEFTQDRNFEGLMRGSDKKGYPKWIPITPKTKEQLIADAEAKKQALIAEATATMAPLQDAVDLGISTLEEISALKEWKTYRVMLNRIDVFLGADVTWPTPPVLAAG